MPPSGYPKKDADIVAAFLGRCVEALVSEAERDHRTAHDSLIREISGIDSVVSEHRDAPFALHTLLLTRALYASLLSKDPKDLSELQKCADGVLAEVSRQISAVHVEHPAPTAV